jgi:hypothetical protein
MTDHVTKCNRLVNLINPSALWVSSLAICLQNEEGAKDLDEEEEEEEKKKKKKKKEEEEEKKKKEKKKKSKWEEEEEKTAVDNRVHHLLMNEKRFKKVRRKLYEEAHADCERIDSSCSGEECSPICSPVADDHDGNDVFGEGEDYEIFLEAATKYEQGLDDGGPLEHRLQYERGLKAGKLAAKVVEAVVGAATKELAGGSPTSEVLPQEG